MRGMFEGWQVSAALGDTLDTVYEKIAQTAFEKQLELPAPYFTIRMHKADAWFPGCDSAAPTVAQCFNPADATTGAIVLGAPSF